MCRSSVAFAQRFNWTDMPQVQQDWPPEWWQVTQAQRSEMMTASIRVPHTRGQWPPVRPRSLLPLPWLKMHGPGIQTREDTFITHVLRAA